MLKVNSDNKSHTIYKIDEQNKALWQFDCGVWHAPFLVSNDGKTVATISWRHLQDRTGVDKTPIKEKTAVLFWRKSKIWKSIKLGAFFSNPPKTQDVAIGPIGDFWRTWYKDLALTQDGFSLLLTNEKVVSFSFTSGAVTDNPKIKLFPLKKEHKVKVKYLSLDKDKDGIPNRHEKKLGLDPDVDDSKFDNDNDGFSNLSEYQMEYSLNDTKDHPSIIYRCSVLSKNKTSITILNHLTGEKVILPLNKEVFLRDKSKQPFKYKLTKITNDHAVVGCYVTSQKVKITDKAIIEAPLKK